MVLLMCVIAGFLCAATIKSKPKAIVYTIIWCLVIGALFS